MANQESTSPVFGAPPVIEMVICAQFSRLEGFTAAHAGLYWERYLSPEWKAQETVRLDDQLERFEEGVGFFKPGFRLMAPETARIQFIRKDEERMIQIQDSRFILNWRKRTGGYPTYKVLLDEFKKELPQFARLAEEKGLGRLEFNQWEITYLNHEPRGVLWDTPTDWPKILPDLCIPSAASNCQFETINAGWRYTIGEELGRLYVNMRHGRTEEKEILSLDLTARGPVKTATTPDSGSYSELYAGVETGHKSIVWSFVAMTSKAAQAHWKRSF